MKSIQDKIRIREEVTSSIRSYLKSKNYHEADVPVLVPSLIPESYLEPFETTISGPNLKSETPKGHFVVRNPKSAYLTASPEAFLKRLLVEGSGNIYYLGKAFRNGEPFGPLHNHEFTILEWYHVGYDYKQLMKEIEEMVQHVMKNIVRDGHARPLLSGYDLSSPWETITIEEAFDRFVPEKERLQVPGFRFQEVFEKWYVQYIEPDLGTRGKPTFITDFPAWQSPLAKTRNNKHETINKSVYSLPFNVSKNDIVAERFELYINGVELINGWTELTDYKQQTVNFKREQEVRRNNGKSPIPTDTGFLEALKKGMPACAGAAMGVDRLLMVLTGAQTLEEVILFPVSKLFQ